MKLAEEAESELTGPRQQEWLTRLEDEHDNLRAALKWAREDGNPEAAEIGLRLVGALSRFWYIRGYRSEGREQLATALERWKAGTSERLNASYARALNGAGLLAWM